MRRIVLVLISLSLTALLRGLEAQTTVELRGTSGGVDQGRVNDDPEEGLKVRTLQDTDFSGPDWQTGSSSAGDIFGDAGDARLVLEFDLSAIPSGETISAATLHVFVPTDVPANQQFLVRFANSVFSIDCHHLLSTNDGQVTTADYSSPISDLGVLIPAGVDPFAGSPSEYVINVTSAVQSDRDAGDSHASFRLKSAPFFTDKTDHYVLIATEGYRTSAFRPFLNVTHGDGPPDPDPEPERSVADFVGSNGYPGLQRLFDSTDLWNEMGMRFYRHDVLWGEVETSQDNFDFSPSVPDALNHDSIISTASTNGFEGLIILGTTAPWATTGPAVGTTFRTKFQSYHPPTNIADWVDYVDRTVERYVQPPYNVRFYEVWNEPFAEFWEGTRDQYVDDILIPAAQAIHAHGAKVVAPGWAGASTPVLEDWISYNDAWMHIDILSTHYNSGDRNVLYNNWIANGRIEGLWHTEVSGWLESENPLFIAQRYPDTLEWYLTHDWDSPDKYKYLYWTDGINGPFGAFLINRSGSGLFLEPQGRAMRTFTQTFSGEIAVFTGAVSAPGSRPAAFRTSSKMVLALKGAAGGGTITIVISDDDFTALGAVAVDVVEGDEQNLSMVQTAGEIRLTLPVGDSYRYVRIDAASGPIFVRGDCNSDGLTSDIADAMFLIFHNFAGTAGPECRAACDANGDGDIGGVSDAIYMVLHVFLSGSAPEAPYPSCGGGTLASDDVLGCETPTAGCP